MELLKCKSIIALIIMMLGVSYITALDNSAVEVQPTNPDQTINY